MIYVLGKRAYSYRSNGFWFANICFCVFFLCSAGLRKHFFGLHQKSNRLPAFTAFRHSNASASYGVEAVEQKIDPSSGKPTNALFNSPKNWTLTNVLGQSNDIYTAGHPPILEQAIFLDTSSTRPNTSASASLPYAGCTFIFDLPQSDMGKADNGDCTAVLDKDCVDELQIRVQESAASLDSQQHLSLEDACGQIAVNVNSSGNACQKYKSKNGITIGNGYTQYSST